MGSRFLHTQASVQFQENQAVTAELRNILAKLQQILPGTFDHGAAHWQQGVISQLHAIKCNTEQQAATIAHTGTPIVQDQSATDFLNNLLGPVKSSDRKTAGASKNGLGDIGSPGGGAPFGYTSLQDDSYDDEITLTSYMLAFRLALTKEYMQRMNATPHPGYEYTLQVTNKAEDISQASNKEWDQMLLRLCKGTPNMYTIFENCSHTFEFVILHRKKQTEKWHTLHVKSVSVDVTVHFLMYIADAIWHVHRRLAWNKNLIAFLFIKPTIPFENLGHRDLINF